MPAYPTANHELYDYSAIIDRPDFNWPGGKRLAFYVAVNLETFSFGNDTGPTLNGGNHAPDVMNYSWREYGNRVGVWRFLELFNDLEIPAAALVNMDMYDAAPRVLEAFRKRGDEFVAHGRTNAEKPGQLSEAKERELLEQVRNRMKKEEGKAPAGYLAPHISNSKSTPKLLKDLNYEYQLDWAMDDQPVWLNTEKGKLLSVPYPAEVNDIPQLIGRNKTGEQFGAMIGDAFETLKRDSRQHSRVMGVSLHPYLMGQPHRFTQLRKALTKLRERAGDKVWFTTPGEINAHYRALDSVK
ncbi:polysaccharide deacetylase family protein [Neolewinella antarctica]|uniref:Peptidoglycan/xylan/chitin deacetylase (PgdA/CDA1 family) n=1 Tax=Neolewinella antarctica TaxID=442734 RepID=A0ABX0XD04_9BACT|nr:polysaccharide deacetylase family protein [Neolewinella antarctica]NJC26774.1 peptidoglycan/xylan/chitin deacetylase (PgdA/CDA1 family) [Neolewinella antarctica]